MDKCAFHDLLKSARDMGRHMRGQRVAGVRETVIEEPEASAVREAVEMSQREFASLVGVPVKTLQNWELKEGLRFPMSAPQRSFGVVGQAREMAEY